MYEKLIKNKYKEYKRIYNKMPIKVYKRKSKNTLARLLKYLEDNKIQILIIPDYLGEYKVITIDSEDCIITTGFEFCDDAIAMSKEEVIDRWQDEEVFHAIVASTGTDGEILSMQYENSYKEILRNY